MSILWRFFDFLVSSWIWNLTFALSYPFWAAVIMTFVLKKVVGTSWVRAIFLAITAQLAAIVILSTFVGGVLVYLLDWNYEVQNLADYELNRALVWRATALLGVLYAVLQIFYFWLINGHLRKRVTPYILSVWITHAITIFVVYSTICLTFLKYS